MNTSVWLIWICLTLWDHRHCIILENDIYISYQKDQCQGALSPINTNNIWIKKNTFFWRGVRVGGMTVNAFWNHFSLIQSTLQRILNCSAPKIVQEFCRNARQHVFLMVFGICTGTTMTCSRSNKWPTDAYRGTTNRCVYTEAKNAWGLAPHA